MFYNDILFVEFYKNNLAFNLFYNKTHVIYEKNKFSSTPIIFYSITIELRGDWWNIQSWCMVWCDYSRRCPRIDYLVNFQIYGWK